MKKAGIFAVGIALILLLLHFYNYKLWAYMSDDCYVINAQEAANRLKNGYEEGEISGLNLSRYEASAPIYTRSSKFFIGSDYQALDVSYPVYVNEGNYLYALSDEIALISSDFQSLNTYAGLYVADGRTYNDDREQADPEEFLFARTSDGLYFNVQDMTIYSQSRSRSVSSNSLMALSEDEIRYFTFDNGLYRYDTYGDLYQADVEIGSVRMSWADLLASLGEVREYEAVSGVIEENPQSMLEPEAAPQTLQDLASEENSRNEGNLAESSASADGASSEDTEDQDVGSDEETRNQEAAVKKAAADPVHPPLPRRKSKSLFSSRLDEEEGTADSTTLENQEDNDTAGDSESGDGEDNASRIPQVTLENFEFGVYHCNMRLTINDPSNRIYRGIRLVFYKKDETRASYRKLFRASGDIQASPLEPDTEYDVEGYFDYTDTSGNKVRKYFTERYRAGRTLPVSTLDPIHVNQNWDDSAIRYPYAIRVTDMQMEDAGPQTENAVSYPALSYVSSVRMTLKKDLSIQVSNPQTSMSGSMISRLKRGDTVDWKTEEILSSNTAYHYEIALYDRYGNALPLTKDSTADGQAATSKITPEASIIVDRSSDVKKMNVSIELRNSDDAEYTDGGAAAGKRPYFYITYADAPEAPIRFTMDGSDSEIESYSLKSAKENISITSLLPGTAYTLWVKGSYDLEDNQIHEDELMGSVSTTTDNLSTLGTVSFAFTVPSITMNSAQLRISTRTAVNDALYPFLSKVNLTIEKKNSTFLTYEFRAEDLKKILLQPGQTCELPGDGVNGNPVITVTLPEGAEEMDAWKAFLKGGYVALSFEEGLDSNTEYAVSCRAFAVQGSTDLNRVKEEDVTGRYWKSSFRTLRKKPYVTYDMSFINGSTATFYDLRIVDPDGTVSGGNVMVRLKTASGLVIKDVRSYSISELARMDEITFRDLDAGTSYILEWVAQEYNEAFTSATRKLQEVLYLQDGSQIRFTAQDDLWGKITPDNMQRDILDQDVNDGISVSSINLLDINEITMGNYLDGNGVEIANTTYGVSDYIEVTPWKPYVIGGGVYSIINLYDENRRWIRSENDGNRGDYPGVFVPLDGVAYIRVSVYETNLNGAFVSEAIYAETGSGTNLLKGKTFVTGAYLYTDGTAVVQNNNTAGYAYLEDYIEVEPGKRYARMYPNGGSQDWNRKRVFFYDAEKNYVSSTDAVYYGNGTFTIPDNVYFVRMDLDADHVDQVFFGRMSDALYGDDILDGAIWHDGTYVTNRFRYQTNTLRYQRYCDYIAVKPTATYLVKNAAGIQVLDADKNFLGYIPVYSGSIRIPAEGAYIRVNWSSGENGTTLCSIRQIRPQYAEAGLHVSMDLTLSDAGASLGANPSYSLIYTRQSTDGEITTWEESRNITYFAGRKYEGKTYLDADMGCQYQVDLVVYIGGRKITLDSTSFSTGRIAGIIRTEAALRAVNYAPMDDYMVTDDIEITKTGLISAFYGTMDFQGHQLKAYNNRQLVSLLYDGAVIENLVMDLTLNTKQTSYTGTDGLCYENRGTIQNMVMRFGLDNERDNYSFGGIARYNYGTIENFAIQMTSDVYLRRYSGVGVSENYGIMKNGYLVSADNYRIYSGPNQTESHSVRGGIVGLNTGTLENVYAAVTMEESYEEGSTAANDSKQMGLLVGYAKGTVKNGFSVGMTLANGLPQETYGPAVGYTEDKEDGDFTNIFYLPTQTFSNPGYMNRYNTKITSVSLWDTAWMESAINADSAFQTEMAELGYYPQLHMPAVMDGRQPLVNLPSQYRPSQPKIISSTVIEQNEDSARVRILFENRSSLEIKSLTLAKMDLVSDVRSYVSGVADTAIEEGQGLDENGNWVVTVLVTNPTVYRSQYFVYSYVAGLSGNEASDIVYGEGRYAEDVREKAEVALEFYQPITTLDEWRTAFSNSNIDRYGNYRIKADELDFGQLTAADYQSNYRILNNFYGNIDGSWTDADGAEHTVLLKNIKLDSYSWLMDNLYGSLKHIRVDGLQADMSQAASNGTNRGLIRYSYGAEIEDVHIRNAEIYGDYDTGVLVGYAGTDTKILNCSVSDSTVTTYSSSRAYPVRAGGLIGEGSGVQIENCYVADITINNEDAWSNTGVGGLAGYLGGTNPTVRNCYATGSIRSMYRNIGGLIGQCGGGLFLTDSFSKVDMDVYGVYVGGLVGYLSSYQELRGNLTAGGIFVHSENNTMAHRILGNGLEERLSENYAYSGQLFMKSSRSSDADDAERLLTYAELTSSDMYRSILGWTSYAMAWTEDRQSSGVSDGYLPLLKSTQGEILIWQDPVKLENDEAGLEVVSFARNSDAVDDYHKLMDDWSLTMPFTQPYELMIKVVYDAERYEIESAAIPGLNLNEKINEKTSYIDAVNSVTDGKTTLVRTYPFVVEELGGDIYCLTMVLRNKEDPDDQITLITDVALTDAGSKIYVQISDAAKWNEIMQSTLDGQKNTVGQSYVNIELTGDIDASTLPQGKELESNVKINSLRSQSGKTYSIRNITHTVDKRRDALIADCQSEMRDVKFENIEWKIPDDNALSTYEDVGIISLNQGIMQNVSFDHITVRSGNGERTGCIGQNVGAISGVTLTSPIHVSATGRYVGGLVGYSSSTVRNIRAKGTLTASGDQSGNRNFGEVTYTSDYEVTGSQYVGAVAGYGKVCEDTVVTGVHVVGSKGQYTLCRIGGIMGSGDMPMSSSTYAESNEHRSMIADSVIESDASEETDKDLYLGGITGSGSAYYADAENIVVRGWRGRYVGGLTGSGYIYYSTVSTVDNPSDKADLQSGNYTIEKTYIQAEEYAGGLGGNVYGSGSMADRVEVRALKAYAGGIGGRSYSSVGSNQADRVKVYAPAGAGGVIGLKGSANDINTNLVSRSRIEAGYMAGGIVAETAYAGSQQQNGVISTTITAGQSQAVSDSSDSDADTSGAGNSYAGGIVGKQTMVSLFQSNYTKDVTVTGTGAYVGGLIGESEGGSYYNNYTNATVSGKEKVGGFIGGLTGTQLANNTDYIYSKLYNSYSKANVTGEREVGGIIGSYTGGGYALSEDTFHGIILMGETHVTNGTAGDISVTEGSINNTSAVRPFVGESDTFISCAYLKIADSYKLYENGSEEATAVSSLADGTWASVKPAASGGTAEGDEDTLKLNLKKTLLVTATDLMDERLYTKKLEEGGMYWTGWSTEGLGRMDTKDNPVNRKPVISLTLKIPNGDDIVVNAGTENYLDLASGVTPTATASYTPDGAVKEEYVYQWYRTHYQDRSDDFSISYANNETMELAGRGYYFCRIYWPNHGYYYSPVIKVDTQAYMPYINAGSSATKSGQEGILPGIGTDVDSDDALRMYAGLDIDRIFYGGIEVPDSPATAALYKSRRMAAVQEEVSACAYPSGVDTVNVELGAAYETVTNLKVTEGTQTLLDVQPEQRVYTLKFDYTDKLIITLTTEETTRTVTYDSTDLRRTVMVWNDEYYYTADGFVFDSEDVVIGKNNGADIIHLYKGQALDSDGVIYDVETEEKQGKVTLRQWTEEDETVPLWQFEYDGNTILTYGLFSAIEQGDVVKIVEEQILMKNGEVYTLSSSEPQRGLILDEYNGSVYMSILNSSNHLKDLAYEISVPDGFSRDRIAHMSDTLSTDQPYVLVRYATGIAKGFNYITGDEIELYNAETDVSLLSYATDFIYTLTAQSVTSTSSFADIRKLRSNLVLNPALELELTDEVEGKVADSTDETAASDSEDDSNRSDSSDEDTGSESRNTASLQNDSSDEGSETRSESPENASSEKATDGQTKNTDSEEDSERGKVSTVKTEDSSDQPEAVKDDDTAKETDTVITGFTKDTKGLSSDEAAVTDLVTEKETTSDKVNEEEASETDESSSDGTTGMKAVSTGSSEKKEIADKTEEETTGDKTGTETGDKTGTTAGNSTTEKASTGTNDDEASDSGQEESTVQILSEEDEKSQTGAVQLVTGSSGSNTAGIANDNYVYAFDADEESASLYRKDALLLKNGKPKKLNPSGVLLDEQKMSSETRDTGTNRGLLFFTITAGAAVILSAVLMKRRDRGSRNKGKRHDRR